MTEVAKPADLRARRRLVPVVRRHGAVGAEVHVGVEDPFTPARKAHPAFVLDSPAELEAVGARLAGLGFEVDRSQRDSFPVTSGSTPSTATATASRSSPRTRREAPGPDRRLPDGRPAWRGARRRRPGVDESHRVAPDLEAALGGDLRDAQAHRAGRRSAQVPSEDPRGDPEGAPTRVRQRRARMSSSAIERTGAVGWMRPILSGWFGRTNGPSAAA